MKYFSKFIVYMFFFLFLSNFQNPKFDKRRDDRKVNDWIQLFNGENLDNWIVKIKGQQINTDIKNTFKAENGVLKVDYENYKSFNGEFGHIFYKQPFSNYKLKLQYRFVGSQAKDGQGWAERNSGVMIHSQSPESMKIDQDFPVSIEVQLLGGLVKGEERPTANLCTPGTHVIMDNKLVTTHCIDSSSKTYYGDQWVDLEVIVIQDSIISHKINGKTVISYSKPQIGGEYNTMKSRKGELLTGGYIALQSESHPVEFKNIKLLELN